MKKYIAIILMSLFSLGSCKNKIEVANTLTCRQDSNCNADQVCKTVKAPCDKNNESTCAVLKCVHKVPDSVKSSPIYQTMDGYTKAAPKAKSRVEDSVQQGMDNLKKSEE